MVYRVKASSPSDVGAELGILFEEQLRGCKFTFTGVFLPAVKLAATTVNRVTLV